MFKKAKDVWSKLQGGSPVRTPQPEKSIEEQIEEQHAEAMLLTEPPSTVSDKSPSALSKPVIQTIHQNFRKERWTQMTRFTHMERSIQRQDKPKKKDFLTYVDDITDEEVDTWNKLFPWGTRIDDIKKVVRLGDDDELAPPHVEKMEVDEQTRSSFAPEKEEIDLDIRVKRKPIKFTAEFNPMFTWGIKKLY